MSDYFVTRTTQPLTFIILNPVPIIEHCDFLLQIVTYIIRILASTERTCYFRIRLLFMSDPNLKTLNMEEIVTLDFAFSYRLTNNIIDTFSFELDIVLIPINIPQIIMTYWTNSIPIDSMVSFIFFFLLSILLFILIVVIFPS